MCILNAWEVVNSIFFVHPALGSSDRVFVENASHPENVTVTEGEEAVFQCAISFTTPPFIALDYYVVLEISNPHYTSSNETVFNTCTMKAAIALPQNTTTGNCSYHTIERREIASNSISSVAVYTVRIPRTSTSLNGTTVTCSLRNTYLQWIRVARLTVYPSLPVKNNQVSTIIAIVVPVIVIVLLILLVAVSLTVGKYAVVRKKRVTSTSQDKSKCSQLAGYLGDPLCICRRAIIHFPLN